MLKTKYRLSRSEQIEDSETLRELQAEGVDVGELDDDVMPLDVQVGSPLENSVFDWRKGTCAHYSCYVQLVARMPNIIVNGYDMSSPFDNDIVPESTFGNEAIFNFCAHRFPREKILNERINDGLRFHYRGQLIEGWLLSSGIQPIPQQLPNKNFTSLQLTLFDSLGRMAQANATLGVLRSTKLPDQPADSDKGLYAGPVPEPPSEPPLEHQRRLSYLQIQAENRGERKSRIELWAAERQRMQLVLKGTRMAKYAGRWGQELADWLERDEPTQPSPPPHKLEPGSVYCFRPGLLSCKDLREAEEQFMAILAPEDVIEFRELLRQSGAYGCVEEIISHQQTEPKFVRELLQSSRESY
jgi:hypothetical protein